jgi:hypothetical protein
MSARAVQIPARIRKGIGAALMTFLLAALVCRTVLSQQAGGSAQTPMIRAQSSLVLVDVIGQNPRTGLPVRDFSRDDFHVFDNGREVPIATFDAGSATRPMIVWLTVICNEQGIPGGSARFAGNEALFRSALGHLEQGDTVGVAYWCDNGETKLDLAPTHDSESSIRVLAEVLRPLSFEGGTSQSDAVGEVTFRKMIRLIIQDAHRRNPQPLPVIVFLHGDHTGQPIGELNELVNDFLETSGIVFGIKDARDHRMVPLIGEQTQILHYMAKQTGGEYFSTAPAGYSAALQAILEQLHSRYEIGFIPPAIDGRRHALRVELTKEAQAKHKAVRLRFRSDYIPVAEAPEWAR